MIRFYIYQKVRIFCKLDEFRDRAVTDRWQDFMVAGRKSGVISGPVFLYNGIM